MAAYDRTHDSDHQVADQAVSAALHNLSSEPAGNQTNQ
jgi:hypothetical protein